MSKGGVDSGIGAGNGTYLHHLDLGSAGARHEMYKKCSVEQIDSLKAHNFAFIRRSGGGWTYAIVSDRHDDFIRFVVDGRGSTKVLSRRSWPKLIRLVRPPSEQEGDSLSKTRRMEPSPSSVRQNLTSETTGPCVAIEDLSPLPFGRSQRQNGGWTRDSGVLSLFD